MTKLTTKQTKYLRALAHKRKPVVTIGNAGLTDNVMEEIASSIEHHELLKVKINAEDRAARAAMIDKISTNTTSTLVLAIGHIAVFYRAAKNPVIVLPNK